MADLQLAPSLVLIALVGLAVTAVYGLIFTPPAGKVGYLMLGGVLGALAGQLAAQAVGLASPKVGALHVVEASLGAWLLVWIVRRLPV